MFGLIVFGLKTDAKIRQSYFSLLTVLEHLQFISVLVACLCSLAVCLSLKEIQ